MENGDQPQDFSDTPVVSQERHKESRSPAGNAGNNALATEVARLSNRLPALQGQTNSFSAASKHKSLLAHLDATVAVA